MHRAINRTLAEPLPTVAAGVPAYESQERIDKQHQRRVENSWFLAKYVSPLPLSLACENEESGLVLAWHACGMEHVTDGAAIL